MQLKHQPPFIADGFYRSQAFVHFARKPRVGIELVLGVFQMHLPDMAFKRFQRIKSVVAVVLEVENVEID